MGAFLLAGCANSAGKLMQEIKAPSNVSAASNINISNYHVKRIAVLPFENKSEDKGAGVKVANYFYEQLSRHKEYEVSPPLTVETKSLRMEFLRPRLKEREQKPRTKVERGEKKEVEEISTPRLEEQFDAVVTGRIIRYQNRAGTPLLSNAPASVAYEIYLISMKDGSLLWQAAYDETQQPLDENLLLIDRYLKNGLWWWTSDEMTRGGMERVISTFPGIRIERQPGAPE